MTDFLLPVGQDYVLFEVRVQELFHVVPVQLSILAESLEQARDLLDTHVLDVVLKHARPEVNSVQAPLVRLVVGPKGTKSQSATHVVLIDGAVVLFKVFEHRWVKDVCLDHVVEDVGHVF